MHGTRLYDLVGIGFGPAGIALAAAIHDLGEAQGIDFEGRVSFHEKRMEPGWQTGLLFRNADIQHHYMRDLATPRDPRSRFTFANFLKQHDRIFEFGSLVYGGGGGAVSRIEWSDYVAWAARLLDNYVSYEDPVTAIRLARLDDRREVLAVSTPRGDVFTKSLAFCAGQELHYPSVFHEHIGDRVFHAVNFLDHMQKIGKEEPLNISIIGAGQAAIEIVQYLHGHYGNSRINCIQRSIGFHHGNHSPFVQRMFHPKESDFFFSLGIESRRKILDEVARANYAAVDREAVSALYRTLYEDNLLEKPRVRMMAGTEVVGMREGGRNRFLLDTVNNHDGSSETVAADVVVLATGFVDRPLPSLLEPLRPILRFDQAGNPEVNYDFSLRTVSETNPKIYIPGAAEPSHGLGSSNSFSMIAVKAERVAAALVRNGLLTKQREELQAG